MTDYSAMSDFEINKRVAEILDIDVDEWGYYDPHEWQDAGPIMEDNDICLSKHNNQWKAFTEQHQYNSYNPRRAICIVFLMMNEVRNGN